MVQRHVGRCARPGFILPRAALRRIRNGAAAFACAAAAPAVAFGQGAADAADAQLLKPIAVDGRRETGIGPVSGIAADVSRAGTKTDTPLVEVPQGLSVVTRAQMDQQDVHSVGDSLRYTPGAYADSRLGGVLESVFLRGFGGFAAAAINPQMLDGLPLPKGVNWAASVVDPSMLERVDVLRGPASVLYGQASPGGIVDMVSKRPTRDAQRLLAVQAGNRDRAQVAFDFSGPLTQDGQWAYRIDGVARRADEQTDYSKQQRVVIAPSLTWRPNADTSLTLLTSYQRDPYNGFAGWLPALGTRWPGATGQIPTQFFPGLPDFDTYDRKQAMIGYAFEHRFNPAWKVRQNLRYTHLDVDFKGAAVNFNVPYVAPGVLNRSLSWSREHVNHVALDNQVEVRVPTGPVEHTVLAGLSYEHAVATMSASGFGAAPPLDTRHPDYGQPFTVPPLAQQTRQTPDRIGVYLQDQIRWDRWVVTLGGREEWARTVTDDRLSGASARQSERAFTWRAGAVYLFDSGFAPYASYSTSFEPTLGTRFGGQPFMPTKADQVEAGVRYQSPDQQQMASIAAFDIRQRNVLSVDPEHPFFNVQSGEVRSRGIELEGRARLGKRIDVIAAYTYLDTTVRADSNPAVVGKRVAAVPRHLASLWLNYDVAWEGLRGLSVGGGVRYIGRSAGDNVNTFDVPAVTLVDLALSYDLGVERAALKGWRVAAHVNNLFDRTYVSSCFSAGGCFYGPRLSVTGDISYRW
ncbi:TonB-dependent siderophore receptor [Burkholderia stagnalis]|uniref:TonB-dependent siderophore receptor n=1 Tax=Burkholderia stagnalis TaxID=1503054 RepID=UPI000AB6F13E|nr:TonB-dependent siderophore receptor [Burkholderia stagnalis]